LGENPLIRYQRSLESDHPTKALPYKLAMLVQAELDAYVRLNPGWPVNIILSINLINYINYLPFYF